MWLKLSDDFADDCARAKLSDAAFRTHVEGLLWTMRRETAGVLDGFEVKRFAETADPALAVRELTDKGLWTSSADGHVISHHMEHQIEPEVITKRRANDAERQRRKRAKAAGLPPATSLSRRDKHRDSERDDPRDPGLVGTGRDGAVKAEPYDTWQGYGCNTCFQNPCTCNT